MRKNIILAAVTLAAAGGAWQLEREPVRDARTPKMRQGKQARARARAKAAKAAKKAARKRQRK